MIGLVRTVAVLAALWILAEFQARATQGSLRLLRQSDLVYQGAFRLPSGAVGTSSFAYGGTALAFNAARRSLVLVGHRLAPAGGGGLDTGSAHRNGG